HRHRVVTVSNDPDHVVEVAGVAHRIARDAGRLVRAPAPSLVVSVAPKAGDELREGEPVAVLESMKMETAVPAPFDGVVREVLVAGNVQVDAGAPLVRMEPLRSDETATPGPRVDFVAAGGTAAAARDLAVLDEIGSLFTGFDEGEKEAMGLADRLTALHAERPGDPALVERSIALLRVFTDIAELTRNRPPLGVREFAEEAVRSPLEHFHRYLRSLDAYREGLPAALRESLTRALAHYGIADLSPGSGLAEAAYRIFLAEQRAPAQLPAVSALLEICRAEAQRLPPELEDALRETLNRLVAATEVRHPAVGELARSVRFACFDQPAAARARDDAFRAVNERLDELAAQPDAGDHAERMASVVESPYPLIGLLGGRIADGVGDHEPMLEVMARRYYKIRRLRDPRHVAHGGRRYFTATYDRHEYSVRLVASLGKRAELPELLAGIKEVLGTEPATDVSVGELYLAWDADEDADALAATLGGAARDAGLPPDLRRLAVALSTPDGSVEWFTFRSGPDGVEEERVVRGMHPMIARRLRFWRLKNFEVSRVPSSEDNYLFHCAGGEAASEERFVVLSEVRDLTPVRGDEGQVISLPALEETLAGCLEDLRRARAQRPGSKRFQANQIFLYVWPPVQFPVSEFVSVARGLGPITEGVGLEEVLVHIQVPEAGGPPRDRAIRFSYQPGAGVEIDVIDAPDEPVGHLDRYREKVLASRRRGTVYPYELLRMAVGPGGAFAEHDLADDGSLEPVDRPPGENTAGIVAGVITTPTDRYPEGMMRVALFGDPTRALGSVSEPECARVLAAIDLAETMGVPLEWYALSSGAKISRDTGTENMDWVSRVLKRIITFTQDGGEINVVVAGINVGAQPYWNAEATMLMHTRGALIMTPDSAMVLTGKQALDYSGGVSAEDNLGIGGYDRIMGPNGQAQYWAPDLAGACRLLLDYYAHSYVAPGERFPRRARTDDPRDRDVREHAHEGPGTDFHTAGEIFSSESNPDRKRPFDIRSLMGAVADQDHPTLERWAGMADAETVVVYDAHLGGIPHVMLGIESRPLPRHHMVPADGPDVWTAGTLFPVSSKKAARAINAASGNRPLVVLANLTGFDGSPESLRKCQLEYGAEIGRAVVNFDGPIVFCVVSRYHGGAFVVFSAALNDQMEVLAVEGSYASVIGGAPAAAVVFARDVNKRTDADSRVAEMEARLAAADEADRGRLRAELRALRADVRSEMLGQVANEFDDIHSVERALDVGSVHAIIPAARLRPLLIDAVERGMSRSESDG
ncbi:MAG: carboxyl transferase domain-containing protein, partial [Miltoncostaeaceae bacterium]